jgi:hypothetical protein
MFACTGGAVVASAIAALGGGCYGEGYVEPAVAPPPSYVQSATVVAGPDPIDADVVYVEEPPVVDIETYPGVEYQGTTVYYVGGQWYRRGPRGWAYYRREPAELGRQRESHAHDERWERARAPRPGPQQAAPPARPAVEEPRPVDRGAAPAPRPEEPQAPPERPGVVEPRAPEHGAPPPPPATSKPKGTKGPPEPDKHGRPPRR